MGVPAHPGVRNACAGVLEGGQQADGQVVGHVEELIVVVLEANIAKRMLGVSQQNVR